MKYLLLIATPAEMPDISAEEMEANMPKWFAYTAALEEAGVLIAGEALVDTDQARTCTPSAGTAVDGPYTESKEHIGGFYLLDVASRDEAEAWAQKMPHFGKVEVRQVQTFEGS